MSDSEITRIVDQLQREHSGDPWHGSPMLTILEGIDAAREARKPIAGVFAFELVENASDFRRSHVNETLSREER